MIEDFEVILQGVIDKKRQQKEPHEYNVFFFSPSRGYLAHFLPGCYTSHELQQDTFTIPIGNFTTPYVDFDQSWAILLAADDTFVFILMHVGEGEGYQTWFKVEKRRYYQQWEKAIQLCRKLSNKL